MLVEALSGLDTIKTSGAQSRVQGRWEQLIGIDRRTLAVKPARIATFASQGVVPVRSST